MKHFNNNIPKAPVFSLDSLFPMARSNKIPSCFDQKQAVKLTSARAAIAMILRKIGINYNDEILIPAYHCTAMVEPVVWSGAIPVFYKINEDTSVNYEDIKNKINGKTRVIIIVHYFGFAHKMDRIRILCDRYQIILIEDCAHAFWGNNLEHPIGSYGDYAVTSTMKFFPVIDGGILYSSRHSLINTITANSTLSSNLKILVNMLEKSIVFNRLYHIRFLLASIFKIKDFIWCFSKKNINSLNKKILISDASDGGYGFDPYWLDIKMSAVSNFTMAVVSKRRIIENRRNNYLKLLRALEDIPGGTPLFKTLPEGVVPYVFPFKVEHPEEKFLPMKKAGVPIIRFGEVLWEGVDESVCEVSMELSKKIFQFPVHQELTDRELTLMISTIQKVMR